VLRSITTLWATPFPGGAAVLIPPVLTTDGGVFVGVQTRGGDQVVVGADGRTGTYMYLTLPECTSLVPHSSSDQALLCSTVLCGPLCPRAWALFLGRACHGITQEFTVSQHQPAPFLPAQHAGALMKGAVRLSTLDPPAMFSTGGGAALQPLALGVVAVFPIQPQGVSKGVPGYGGVLKRRDSVAMHMLAMPRTGRHGDTTA
jgi:hypothetical protein